jgi:hypothetical protein
MYFKGLFSLSFYISFIFLKTSAFGLNNNGKKMAFIPESYSSVDRFESPAVADLKSAEDLFYKLFTSPSQDVDQESWAKLGFQIEKNNAFLILKEKQGKKTGKGIYMFNTRGSVPIILEAPHFPSDKYTGTITARFIEEGSFLAAAWSSVHRKKGNLTKEPRSYFNAFSRAFGRAYPKGIIIQIHCFESDKGYPQILSTDLIYSSTLSSPPSRFFTYGKCLKQLPIQLLFYPQEIGILGGTKNINAEKYREVTKEGLFLHLEMSLNLRKRLLKDRSLRTHFINCFIQNEN